MSNPKTHNREQIQVELQQSTKAINQATNMLLEWIIAQSESPSDSTTGKDMSVKHVKDLSRSKNTD